MPLKYLTDSIQWPEWATERYKRLDIWERFYEGTIYDHIPNPFYLEEINGDYIPLRDRRPSVHYNICNMVVSRSVAMLFGGDHWPSFHCKDKAITDFLDDLNIKSRLQAAFIEAATVGSLGAVYVHFRIVDKRVLYEVWKAKYCMPVFDDVGELESILIIYPVEGTTLVARGYKIDEEHLDDMYFFAKEHTTEVEIIYKPILCDEYDGKESLVIDEEVRHGLDFVPGTWIRNTPNSLDIDGRCTFEQIVSVNVEIDYQLSQCGRGLKYNSDPQLLIKEPAGDEESGQMGLFDALMLPRKARSTSNVLTVSEEGDAKLLEISGQGQKAVLEFVKQLRQYALEVARGSRKDPERAYGNMSGRAMEILEEDLISLAGELRVTYGEAGLKPFLDKVLRAGIKFKLLNTSVDLESDDAVIELKWGHWFLPTPSDLNQIEQALGLAVRQRELHQFEARRIAMQTWGIGISDATEAEKEYPIPPPPELGTEEELAGLKIKEKAASRPVAARPPGGGNGATPPSGGTT